MDDFTGQFSDNAAGNCFNNAERGIWEMHMLPHNPVHTGDVRIKQDVAQVKVSDYQKIRVI
jgi:hypothetical protein